MSAPERKNLISTGGMEGLTTYEMLANLKTIFSNDLRLSIFLWGPTGIGKSAIVRQLLCELGNLPADTVPQSNGHGVELFGDYGLIDLRVSLLDPSDLRGLPFPQQGLAKWFAPEELPIVGQEQRFPARGILLLDEFTHAPDSVQKACYSLVLNHRIGPHQLLPGWRVMAASNLLSERSRTHEVSHPLKNRFLHYDLRADLEAFKRWAFAAGINPLILAFLNWYPVYLHLDNDPTQNAFPTPRSWSYVSDVLKLFANGHRLDNIAACIGKGTASLFHGFLEVYEAETSAANLRNLEAALRGKAKLPPLTGEDIAKAHAISARLTSLYQQDPKQWAQPILKFLLSPVWDNLREIARGTVSDIAIINRDAYAAALQADDGDLNKRFFKVFGRMAMAA